MSKTLIKVCNDLNIEYIRYERKSYFNDLKDNENIIFIDKYEYLEELFKNIDGNILNTTGSNNALKIEGLKSEKNRIIHRILPSPKVISRLLDNGISMENIIAIKGPFGFEINNATGGADPVLLPGWQSHLCSGPGGEVGAGDHPVYV